MNKSRKFFMIVVITAALASFGGAVHAQTQAKAATDDFFVISSVEKTALVLLHPTQITATLNITDKTQIVDEQNKPLKLSDLRTGDTIFVTYNSNPDGSLVATHVRKGMMTVQELRKRYVPSLPATAGQTGAGH